MSPKVAIVYHSGFGHTSVQAESVRDVAASTGAVTSLISVDDIEDNRDQLDEADAIIFGSPTYMGSVSGPFESFMDASSGTWHERRWQDKLVAGFTNSASQSDADSDPDIAPPASDRKTAYHLGQRVAKLAATWQPAQSTTQAQEHATA